jgi:hypothetical protein
MTFHITPKLHALWAKDIQRAVYRGRVGVLMEYLPLPWHNALAGTSDVLGCAPGSDKTKRNRNKLNDKIK